MDIDINARSRKIEKSTRFHDTASNAILIFFLSHFSVFCLVNQLRFQLLFFSPAGIVIDVVGNKRYPFTVSF